MTIEVMNMALELLIDGNCEASVAKRQTIIALRQAIELLETQEFNPKWDVIAEAIKTENACVMCGAAHQHQVIKHPVPQLGMQYGMIEEMK